MMRATRWMLTLLLAALAPMAMAASRWRLSTVSPQTSYSSDFMKSLPLPLRAFIVMNVKR